MSGRQRQRIAQFWTGVGLLIVCTLCVAHPQAPSQALGLVPAPDLGRMLENAPYVVALRDGKWLYPAIQTLHILGFATLFGVVMLTDLRILGAAKSVSIRGLHRLSMLVCIVCVIVIVPTGLMLFATHATTLIDNPAFQIKLMLLFGAVINALIFATGPYQSASSWDVNVSAPGAARLCAVLSMILWTSVILCGRLIHYV